jgi:hypothetical protein
MERVRLNILCLEQFFLFFFLSLSWLEGGKEMLVGDSIPERV